MMPRTGPHVSKLAAALLAAAALVGCRDPIEPGDLADGEAPASPGDAAPDATADAPVDAVREAGAPVDAREPVATPVDARVPEDAPPDAWVGPADARAESPDVGADVASDAPLPSGVKLVVTPAMINFGDGLVNVESAPVAAIVKNVGADISAPLVVSVNARDFVVTSNSCFGVLAPEQSCTISLAFRPDTTGPKVGVLLVVAKQAMATAALTGTATLPATLSISPAHKSFGDVVVGEVSAPASFSVSNDGDVESPHPTITTTGDFAVKTNGCTAALPRRTSCTVDVVFAPGTLGIKAGTMTVALPGAAAAGSATVALSGRGVQPPNLMVLGATSFPDTVVGHTSAQQDLKVLNASATRLSGLQVAVEASLDFLASSNCGDALDGGASCDVHLVFKPRGPGARIASLLVSTKGTSTEVLLTGKGLAPAHLVASPATLTFAATPAGTRAGPLTVTFRNDGDEEASQLAVTGGGAPFVINNSCPATLSGGASCTVAVEFAPTEQGTPSATLTAQAAPGGIASAALGGQAGPAASLTITPKAVDFGGVDVGSSSAATSFTVTNGGEAATGALAVTVDGEAGAAAQLVLETDGCTGSALAAHASCMVTARFKPSAAAAVSAILTVHADPGGQVGAQLRGTGLGPAQLVVAPALRDLGYVPIGGGSAFQGVRVTNAGGQTSAPLAVDAGSNVFLAARDECTGTRLMAGQSCSFDVAFTPLALGDQNANVVVSAAGASVWAVLKLSGRGVAPSGLGFQDYGGTAVYVVDFTDPTSNGQAVGMTGDTVTVPLRNLAMTATGLITLAIDGADFLLGPAPGLASLEPGEQAMVTVAFKPTAAGDRRAVITATAAAGGTASLLVLGRGR